MNISAKDKMIDGAITLLATKGLQATSFTEVLALTGAPRGSIYHHFPEGKDQLITAALQKVSKRTIDTLQSPQYASPLEFTQYFIDMWRQLLVHSQFTAGCSVLAVVVSSDSLTLTQQANAIFQQWEEFIVSTLGQLGVSWNAASPFAKELISTTEGAVVLSRAARDIAPFEAAIQGLLDRSRTL